MKATQCTVEDCERPVQCKLLCKRHYDRFRKYGNPLGSAVPKPLRLCSVQDCGQTHLARGYCASHYRFARDAGTISDAPRCSIDGCEAAVRGRGWCNRHWQRWKNNGHPERTVVYRKPQGSSCVIEGCDKPNPVGPLCHAHKSRLTRERHRTSPPGRICEVANCGRRYESSGYCSLHLYRVRTYGDPVVEPPSRKSERPGYSGVHIRLRHIRGRACDHRCVDCDRQADDWSYNGGAPSEERSRDGLPFTVDLGWYSPRCKKCHRNFDLARVKMESA
jgi:hypothetical protein